MTQVNGNGFLLRQSLKKRRWLQGLTPPPCLEAGTLDPVRAATWVGSFNLGRAPVAQGWMCQSLHPSLEAGDAEEPGTVSAPGFSEAMVLQPFFKTRGSYTEAEGSCSEVSTQGQPVLLPPPLHSQAPGHKWLTVRVNTSLRQAG